METNAQELITTPTEAPDDKVLDFTLRPKIMRDFVGQKEIKENLDILMGAAKKRREPIEHVLLYGNPGLGKTTLAHIIAREMEGAIRVSSGPTIERVGDLAAILTNLGENDVLFIDEIHRLNKSIEEVLYSAMEEYALDLVVGKGPAARTLRLDLPRFTLIGATTRMSLLSSPLRDRFGATYHLTFYTQDDIEKILARSAKLLNIKAEPDALTEVAKRARRTPRIANRLLRRVRDFGQVKSKAAVTRDVALEALGYLNVDPHGLDEIDRRLLSTIIEKFSGGPVGLNALAAATAEEEATIEEIYEPYLMQLGLLDRTPRGRVATTRAYEHLGVHKPGGLL
ncbi:Holliday junction branch migration DNA helicase RuvB [Candidatus Uhrbacteria bacterium]|nr:Holliday junction branch migration DNA helicase RuvB [Candidatus Uhrbacteria bacterium]